VTAGKTLQEAQRLAGEALTLHIAGMAEDGDAIPVPSTLEELVDDPLREGALVTLVRVGDKRVRINITAKKSQVEKIDEFAKNAGLSRSAYMVRSSLARIRQTDSRAKRALSLKKTL
jgi:hypothetical protein